MAESKGFEEEARSLLKIAELSATSVPCSCDPLPPRSTTPGLAMPGHSPTDSRLSRDAIAGISARARQEQDPQGIGGNRPNHFERAVRGEVVRQQAVRTRGPPGSFEGVQLGSIKEGTQGH